MTEKQIQNKLIRAYYGLNYQEARLKIRELEACGELVAVLKLALAQDRMECPPCPHCGGEMSARTGRNGPFFGCLAYPKCRGTRSMVSDILEVTTEQKKEAAKKLTCALSYIQDIGGADSARHWLNIATQSVGEGAYVPSSENARSDDQLGGCNNPPEIDNSQATGAEGVCEPGTSVE